MASYEVVVQITKTLQVELTEVKNLEFIDQLHEEVETRLFDYDSFEDEFEILEYKVL